MRRLSAARLRSIAIDGVWRTYCFAFIGEALGVELVALKRREDASWEVTLRAGRADGRVVAQKLLRLLTYRLDGLLAEERGLEAHSASLDLIPAPLEGTLTVGAQRRQVALVGGDR